MGEPVGLEARHLQVQERTRGTETSKYPQAKKSNEIPRVVVSESGRAQTGGVTALPGLKDRDIVL